MGIARNSLCQFWNDSNQNRESRRTRKEGLAGAVLVLLLVVSAAPPIA